MQDEAVFRGDAITDMVTDHHLMPASIRWKHLNHFGWVCWHQARVKLCCVTAQISGHPFAQIHRARRVTMPPDEQLRQPTKVPAATDLIDHVCVINVAVPRGWPVKVLYEADALADIHWQRCRDAIGDASLMLEDVVVVTVINGSLPVIPLKQEGVVNAMTVPKGHAVSQVFFHVRPDCLLLNVWRKVGVLTDEDVLRTAGISTLIGLATKVEVQSGRGVEGHGIGWLLAGLTPCLKAVNMNHSAYGISASAMWLGAQRYGSACGRVSPAKERL